jgi:hypothetical protein
MATDTYSHRLSVAFTDYVSRIEAGTGKTVDKSIIPGLAMHYAFEAAKDVTSKIMENSRKLDARTSRPTEFSISKRRIDSAWNVMKNDPTTFASKAFKTNLIKLLTTLSTPTEAEIVSAEVVGDRKMIERTTADYKEILSFLNTF